MKVLGLEDIICQPSATAKTNLHMGHPSGWPFAYANSTHLLKGRKSIHLSIFEDMCALLGPSNPAPSSAKRRLRLRRCHAGVRRC